MRERISSILKVASSISFADVNLELYDDFARQKGKDFRSHGRTDEQKHESIARGFLGQDLFLKMCSGTRAEEGRLGNSDPGWDIVLDWLKIDIKTYKRHENYIRINMDFLRAQVYVLLTIDYDKKKIYYSGYLTADEIHKHAELNPTVAGSKWSGWYVHRKHFENGKN